MTIRTLSFKFQKLPWFPVWSAWRPPRQNRNNCYRRSFTYLWTIVSWERIGTSRMHSYWRIYSVPSSVLLLREKWERREEDSRTWGCCPEKVLGSFLSRAAARHYESLARTHSEFTACLFTCCLRSPPDRRGASRYFHERSEGKWPRKATRQTPDPCAHAEQIREAWGVPDLRGELSRWRRSRAVRRAGL